MSDTIYRCHIVVHYRSRKRPLIHFGSIWLGRESDFRNLVRDNHSLLAQIELVRLDEISYDRSDINLQEEGKMNYRRQSMDQLYPIKDIFIVIVALGIALSMAVLLAFVVTNL